MKNVLNIDEMDGHQFEELIENLLKKMDFITERRKVTSDGGIDIIAHNSQPLYKGKYIIQCKRFTGTIGEPILRDLYGVVNSENANKGILITNSTFTSSAIEFARNKQLELIDGSKLSELLDKYLSVDNSTSTYTLRVPEVYSLTYNSLYSVVTKILKRKEDIKNNLIYLNKRSFNSTNEYGAYTLKRINKLADLSATYFSQFNHLNELWSSKTETYETLREAKVYLNELVRTLNIIGEDWEDLYSIAPPPQRQNSHSLLCLFYDVFPNKVYTLLSDLKQIIDDPLKYTDGSTPITLSYTVSLEGKEKEFSETLAAEVKREKGGCFIATAVYSYPISSEVTSFYKFRDNVLKKSLMGRQIIRIYYKVSPNLAIFISEHPLFKRYTRIFLDAFIKVINNKL